MSEIALQRQYANPFGMTYEEMQANKLKAAAGWGRFKPSDLLRDAMAFLDQKGWCQGGLASKSGEVCGHGSIVGAGNKIRTALPWTVVEYEGTFDMGFGSFVGNLTMDFNPLSPPNMPKAKAKDNPERLHVENAMVRAHDALIEVAKKAGWKSEGRYEFLDPFDVMGLGAGKVPFKDAFAVFNDHKNTTIEDVVLMMKEAVAWLESQGE